MGYRSDFKIACEGPLSQLHALHAWLVSEAYRNYKIQFDVHGLPCTGPITEYLAGYSCDQWLCEFLEWMEINESEDHRGRCLMIIDIHSAKCYGEFGEAVHALLAKAAELGLEYAYARVGEDLNDNETQESSGLYIPILKSIGDPE